MTSDCDSERHDAGLIFLFCLESDGELASFPVQVQDVLFRASEPEYINTHQQTQFFYTYHFALLITFLHSLFEILVKNHNNIKIRDLKKILALFLG